jgi:hypothetical protein
MEKYQGEEAQGVQMKVIITIAAVLLIARWLYIFASYPGEKFIMKRSQS